MAGLLSLLALTALSSGVAGQVQQNLTLLTPQSIPQCGSVTFQWAGGTPPYEFVLGTTNDASVSSVSVTPTVQNSLYTYSPVDLPAGTPFTYTVIDNAGNRQESQRLVVGPSSNSSCLSSGTSSPSTKSKSSSVQSSAQSTTGTSTDIPSTTANATSATGTSTSSSASRKPPIALIAGVVGGVVGAMIVIVVLLTVQKRLSRREKLSSKEALIRTFGPTQADLDSEAGQGPEEMAMPEPYVYRGVTRPSNMTIEGTSSRRGSSGPSARSPSTRSPSTPSTRNPKGERYLPDYGRSPQEGRAGMQDEDIDRLAARMVAMMSAGRLGDQAWTPTARSRDPDLEDISSAPPLYKDVAKEGSGKPGER